MLLRIAPAIYTVRAEGERSIDGDSCFLIFVRGGEGIRLVGRGTPNIGGPFPGQTSCDSFGIFESRLCWVDQPEPKYCSVLQVLVEFGT